MYTYILLICFIVGMIYLNLKLYNDDYLSPSFLYNISILLSLICAFLGLLFWNDVKVLTLKATIIVVVSILFFNMGEFVCRKYLDKNYKIKSFKNEIKNIPLWKSLIQLVFVFLVFILVLFEVHRIASIVGYNGGIFNMIKTYRSTSILFSTEYIKSGIHINFIVAQLQKVSEVICYVNIYLLSCSMYKKELFKTKNSIVYFSNILICILMSLLIGSRMQVIVYVLFFSILCVLHAHKKNTYKNILKIYWKYLIIFLVSGAAMFYLVLPLLGRNTKANIIEYTTFYFGAPIPSLQKYLDSLEEKPKLFGEETFRGIQNVAYKLHLSNYIQPITTKWTSFYTKNNVKMQSNIYTSSKRYYHDFGYLGVVILQFINGFIFSLLYIIMNKKKTNLSIIFYVMYLYMVIDQVRDEYLFSTFVHINTIFKFVVLYCLLYFLEHDTKEIKSLFTRIKKFEVTKNEIKNR